MADELIDGLIKPDIAAPGNKIVSAEALGSSLVTNYPAIHEAGTGEDAYATLSGTSMSCSAPGRFDTMTCWPNRRDSRSP